MMDLSKLAAAASADSPQGLGASAPIPGRTLYLDGDGLCYVCAGNDDTDVGQARTNLFNKINTTRKACAASRVVILMTGQGSPKGDRYYVARQAPYQGQRSGSSRPKNWTYLRQFLSGDIEVPAYGQVRVHTERYLEADDCFSVASQRKGAENIVICTQDKDMRMVPGHHLNWDDYSMCYVSPGTWSAEHNGKVFGRKWFWLQMMHGDKADNIPGLPYYTDGSVVKSGPNKGQEKRTKVGDKCAILADLDTITNDRAAAQWALQYYKTCYGDTFSTCLAMLEQGILLWIRPTADVFSVAEPGNPLYAMSLRDDWPDLQAAIRQRIHQGTQQQAEPV